MSDEIVWQDPPEYVRVIGSGRSPGRHAKFAARLKEYPGKWAILPDAGVTTEKSAEAKAQSIRRGKVKGFEDGEWETAPDGLTIYVRYVGEAAEPDPTRPESPRGGSGSGPTEEEGEAQPLGASPAKIRSWAKTQGLDVPDRGRISRDVVMRYNKAMGGPAGPDLRAVPHQ